MKLCLYIKGMTGQALFYNSLPRIQGSIPSTILSIIQPLTYHKIHIQHTYNLGIILVFRTIHEK